MLLYQAAEKGYIKPCRVEEIPGISEDDHRVVAKIGEQILYPCSSDSQYMKLDLSSREGFNYSLMALYSLKFILTFEDSTDA